MESAYIDGTSRPEEVVCRAARNDYMEEFNPEMTFRETMMGVDSDAESHQERKKDLIHGLLDDGHFGPFEHPQFTFAFKDVSRVCMAQITRHRHATFDIQSLRYTAPGADEELETTEDIREYIVLPPDFDFDHVGSGDNEDDKQLFLQDCLESFQRYQELLDRGYKKEDARFVLPMATAVNIVVSLNARAMMHILDMRGAGDAQWEANQLADELLEFGHELMPHTFEYYDEEMSPRKNRLAP